MMTQIKRDSKRENRFLLTSIIIVLVVTLTPGDGTIGGHYLDKLVHFLIFFLLSLSVNHKYRKYKKLFWALMLSILLGPLTEYIQQYIPGRNMDFYDGIADTLGVIAGYFFYKAFRDRIERKLSKK